MPRHQEPKKDVASCEKPRGAASRLRSVDVRMGKPTASNSAVPLDEYIVQEEGRTKPEFVRGMVLS